MDHHFVPQFYLRAFRDPTVPEGQEPWLWVGDLKEKLVQRRAPKNVGKKANYYAFPEFDAESPDTLEQLLSKIESAAAPVVRKMLDGELELAGQDRASILFFMAFFVGRSPFFRNMVEGTTDRLVKLVMRTAASHPEYFGRKLREAHEGREFTPEEVEELRQRTLDESNYTVHSPEFSLQQGFQVSIETVYPLFSRMKWAVLRGSGADRFITCDSPVSWFDPTPRPPFYAGHGLAMRNVEATFPVSPELCLLGTWEGPTGVLEVPDAVVAEFNRRRVGFADRYVFADRGSLVRAAMGLR
ncbi:MAG: DUF4238 domain-containing protein [Nitrospinota bacterium]